MFTFKLGGFFFFFFFTSTKTWYIFEQVRVKRTTILDFNHNTKVRKTTPGGNKTSIRSYSYGVESWSISKELPFIKFKWHILQGILSDKPTMYVERNREKLFVSIVVFFGIF